MAMKVQGGRMVPAGGGDASQLAAMLQRQMQQLKDTQIMLFRLHNEMKRQKNDMPTGNQLVTLVERADDAVEKLALAINDAMNSARRSA
jgi:hypothetical protein